jgi:hypothetical protein
MYIKQVIENRESWWGYILTVILIVPVAVFLFSIPHGIILTSKAFGDEELMANSFRRHGCYDECLGTKFKFVSYVITICRDVTSGFFLYKDNS